MLNNLLTTAISRNFAYCITFICLHGIVGSVNAQSTIDRLNPFKKTESQPTPPVRLSVAESKTIINDIIQLSGSNMNGRIRGTTGEQVAISYLTKRFRDIGLLEIDKNYQRKYTYSTGDFISEESVLTVNNETVRVPTEGFPLAFSDTQRVETYIVSGANEPHSVWILPAYRSADEAKKSFEEREKLIYQRIKNAKERGAVGVIIYNNLGNEFVFEFRKPSTLPNMGIPVFEISKTTYEKKFSELKSLTALNIQAKVTRTLKQGVNLYGIINNNAAKTVIISANYDGYVPPTVDMKKLPHLPGANTNASGVAAVLALAEKLKNLKSNYNYMIILYSGTYNNLEGSIKMFEDKNFFKEKIAFAIHFDPIGRMNPTTKNIFVSGVGTYSGWKKYFTSIDVQGYDYVLEQKGKDKSDFQTYYNYKIPYISFSTGDTDDAGTPGDNHTKINMEGIGEVVHRAYLILEGLSMQNASIVFIPATDEVEPIASNPNTSQKTPIPTPTVSLGVIPDLSYKEGGLKVSKVNKGQSAANAGILEGDIIIQIRNYPIQTYDDYLSALSKFKKGEKTYFRLKRKGAVIQKVVTFS